MIADTHPFLAFLLALAIGAIVFVTVLGIWRPRKELPDRTVRNILQDHYKEGDHHGRSYRSEGWW